MPEQHDVAAAKGWRTVLKPNGTDVERSHSVPGKRDWPPAGHPLYGDERTVAAVTDWLLSKGHSILQLFLLDPSEAKHSRMVLERVNAPHGARVLSLGCGVAGMESLWQLQRPDLRFTLVNTSSAQLTRCLCPGRLVQGDMQDPTLLASLGMYDLVVMGYSLHHAASVPSMLTMARAYLKPRGTLLVIDVVEGSERFNAAVQYEALHSLDLQRAGLVRLDHGMRWHRLPAEVLGKHVAEVLDAGEATPSLWLGGA